MSYYLHIIYKSIHLLYNQATKNHSNFLTLVSLRFGNRVGGKVLQFSSGVGSFPIIYLTFLSNSGVHFRATSRHPKFSSNYFTLVAPRRHVLVSVLTIAQAIAS